MMSRAGAMLLPTVAVLACSAPRDGGHLVLGLGTTRAEILASSTELGRNFLEPSFEWPEKKLIDFMATADRVTIRNPVGDELDYGPSSVALQFKDERLCEIKVIPDQRRPCPNDGADVLRFYQRSGFRPFDGATFEEEVQRKYEYLVSDRFEIPEWRDKNWFEVGLVRSDGRAMMTFTAAFDTGKHCFNSVFEVRTCPLPGREGASSK